MAIRPSPLTTVLFLGFVCIVLLSPPVDAAVGGRWHPRRWSGIGNNRLHGRHAAGRRHRQDRPCFICPGSSVLIADLYRGEDDDHANDAAAAAENGHVPRFSVRMPEPFIRPCLYPNQKQLGQPSVTTQVVRGPQPGTPVSQGLHRIVLRVVYEDENNDLTDSSPLHPHKQHAYCRYTIKVVRSLAENDEDEREELQLCQPPPSPDHGKVTCKPVGDDVTVMSCRYSCDEGYVTPRSERHLLLQDWNCLSNSSQAPSCLKLEAPVPIDSSQCSGMNLTVAESDDVHLPLPKFTQTSRSMELASLKGTSGEMIRIDCDVNLVKAPSKEQLSSGAGSVVIVKRFCAARNTETDATFNCTYDVQLNVDPAPERSVMLAELRFQIGQMSTPVPHGKKDMAVPFWCDDVVLVERLMRIAKDLLFAANSEACRIANCTKFVTRCLHTVRPNHSNNQSAEIGESESLLDVTWTVTADYKPFSYEDYFYEGAEVPEGEMLIEKIKAETETMIEGDLGLRREMETAGSRLLCKSFRLARLDLICPLSGYVVNASTNQCQKCPENSYQLKGTCQPCPEGAYQERPGQTECWPCLMRPNELSFHYASRCQKRRSELAGHHHPAIAVLLANKHLIHNKFRHSNGTRVSNTSHSKLGQIAAAVASSPSYHSKNDYHPFKSKVSKKSHKKLRLSSSKTRRNLAEYYPATKGELMSLGLERTKSKSNGTAESVEDDPCWPNPCLSGGKCFRTVRFDDNNNLISRMKCSCRPGATGAYCETPYCPALYCFNGGTCVINHQRFDPGPLEPESRELVNCECPSGFTGRRCEHRRRRPVSPPAQESKKIRHQRRRHEQLLKQTADGASNATNSNSTGLIGTHCASNPCYNGGRCVDNSHAAPVPGFFTCICPPNYQGELCDYMLCPTSVGRTACSQQSSARVDIPYSTSSRASGIKRSHQERCLIHTPTGRRQCAPAKIINKKIRHQHAP